MAFNSDTYRANKHRREAWASLGKAREIKARAAAGNAYSWEIPQIALYVQWARSDMKLYRLGREYRAAMKGQ